MAKIGFDELYDQLLLKEDTFNNEQSPLEQTGNDQFNDENNDFPEEGSEDGDEFDDEEIDVATELRLIIDRLGEILEKITGEDEDSDLEDGEGDLDMGGELEGNGSAFESARSEYKPFGKKGKDLQSKNNKVKSKFKAKKGSTKKTTRKGEDGKMQPAKCTTLGPNSGTKAPGNSPANKAGSDLF
jgi:hypothetical protein